MPYNRTSWIVKAGRLYQEVSPLFSCVDRLVPRTSRSEGVMPFVCIVAPPRSGSTLTYQVLTSGIENLHLTNLWNLLYATPALGALATRRFCCGVASTFRSANGFVPGLCGEAEGMRFWTHWAGQGLREEPEAWRPERLQELSQVLDHAVPAGSAFISGYLGHLFCMELLRSVYPGIIFVHVKRDLLSNSYSMLQRSAKGWFSLVPGALERREFGSVHERVVAQVMELHRIILSHSREEDTLQVDYEALCENPESVLDAVVGFARSHGLDLRRRSVDFPPFNPKSVRPDTNGDTGIIMDVLERLVDCEQEYRKFFSELVNRDA